MNLLGWLGNILLKFVWLILCLDVIEVSEIFDFIFDFKVFIVFGVFVGNDVVCLFVEVFENVDG